MNWCLSLTMLTTLRCPVGGDSPRSYEPEQAGRRGQHACVRHYVRAAFSRRARESEASRTQVGTDISFRSTSIQGPRNEGYMRQGWLDQILELPVFFMLHALSFSPMNPSCSETPTYACPYRDNEPLGFHVFHSVLTKTTPEGHANGAYSQLSRENIV